MIEKNRLKNIELIVFDLDGTLLNKYGEITEETVNCVHELKELGVKFTFATGRLFYSIIDFANQLNINTPIITFDGAVIKNVNGNDVIHESYIKPKYIDKAIEFCNKELIKIALTHEDAICYTPANSIIQTLMDRFDSRFNVIDNYDNYLDKTLEIIICGDYKRPIQIFAERLKFPYALGLKTSFYRSDDEDGTYFLEIKNKKSSKGNGILRLCKHLKINIKKTAVMGDWYNDRSMFRTKALKIAMANAVGSLKEMADHITTKTNNENGVAEFLQQVIEAKKK